MILGANVETGGANVENDFEHWAFLHTFAP
jgi:hypothetical protein